MKVDLQKIRDLLNRPAPSRPREELRREEGVFWVGSALPPRQTLETIFESDCMAPVALFALSFEHPGDFHAAEELVRLLKKNFSGFILGRFHGAPSPAILDAAYAAGVDLLDIPLAAGGLAGNEGALASLDHARTVFPRWSAASTLSGKDASEAALRTAGELLSRGIVPLAEISGSDRKIEEIASFFQHLAREWRRAGVSLKPFRPLLRLTTPLVPPPPRRGLGSFIDRVETAGMRTASDMRRLLRVRRVEASFESAGL